MPDSSDPTVSRRIAAYACRFDPHSLDAAQRRQVGRALIDTVGVALAGHAEPASRLFYRHATARGGHDARATAWGQRAPMPVEEAALYNGVAGHVLDFDDVNSPLRGHPSIALLPPLVALAEARGLDGRRLASAYAVGFEVMVRLARAMVQDHYARGWHATTTLGGIGAAAACCHLLGLPQAQTVNAIGLAVAQASGSRINFGTMAKSFQAGHCGASAVRAALLAELGVDGAPDALDGAEGFATLYGSGEDLMQALQGLGDDELELTSSGIDIKKYPMCYAAHRSLDGMLALRAEHGLVADAITAVHVRSNRRAMVPLIHDRPQTGLEGKFSMQYAMATALLDGHVRLSSFTDEAVRRPAAQALMPRITCSEDDGPQTPRWNTLAVTLADGTVLHKEIRQLRGSAASPLSDDELHEKWRDCLDYAGADGDGDAFFDAALTLDDAPIQRLMARLPRLG
ncbi:MmgE/PrpD family protein [Bordetella genomosp. 13]|uniref:MmgE/PrpD family protein n=1 Tax=Bordetella genomosp. 13 TaxID=463040 RepID=UPI00119F0532|nr:MmgE/PrpD family protein [Bordetella genomosp. 13]